MLALSRGDAVVRSTPGRVVRIQALAGDVVLCSWARHFTLTVPLSTQVYKWVPANLLLGVTLRWTSLPSKGKGGVEILLVVSCYRNRDKLRPEGPLGSYVDYYFILFTGRGSTDRGHQGPYKDDRGPIFLARAS